MTVLLVLLGGAIGAPTRYLTDVVVQSRHRSRLPWGTITVNVVGSLVLGLVAGLTSASGPTSSSVSPTAARRDETRRSPHSARACCTARPPR